jgi:hypothetical protein
MELGTPLEEIVQFPDARGAKLMTTGRSSDCGAAAINPARPMRVLVGVDLDPCEEIAMPRVDFAAGQVTIQMAAWRPVGGNCSAAPQSLLRPVVINFAPLASGNWTISSNGVPNSIALTLMTPPTDCNPSRTPCQVDCDCATGERCVATQTSTVCATPCEVDRDCGGAGSCAGANATPPWSCVASPPECGPNDACPIGWSCAMGACQPDFVLATSTRHACQSNADCSPGLRCVEAADPGTPPSCQAVCETDGPWCSGPHECSSRDMDASGLAGTDAVCGWIGE